MKLRRAGREGLLVELASLDEVLRLTAELRRRAPPGLVDVVPAARTVLLTGKGLAALGEELRTWQLPPVVLPEREAVVIPVTYDGPDLDEVLAHAGLKREEFIALHTGTVLSVAFCGFAPGFAYLTGLPVRLHVPRRATPRTDVAPGAVALGGEFGGVYPRFSPGGWQIIGHTRMRLWDESLDPPSPLLPGTPVRFVAAEAAPTAAPT